MANVEYQAFIKKNKTVHFSFLFLQECMLFIKSVSCVFCMLTEHTVILGFLKLDQFTFLHNSAVFVRH